MVEVLELGKLPLLFKRPGDRPAENERRARIPPLEARPEAPDRVHILVDAAQREHVGRAAVERILVSAVDD